MKFSFTDKPIVQAPADFVRMHLVDGGKSNRFVKDDEVEYLTIGMAKWPKINRRNFITVNRTIIRIAKEHGIKKIALEWNNLSALKLVASSSDLAELIATNFEMANYEYSMKSLSPDVPVMIEEVLICGKTLVGTKKGFQKGQIIGEGVNACRTLANTPGGDMTPVKLVEAAKAAAKGLPVTVRTLGRKEMAKLGMGAILGVSKGSSEEPAFIVMEYRGSAKKPAVLVGKGVTFDSGGLNIKTGDHMYGMHMDMSGGAAVIMSLVTAAKLGLKRHVVALVPAVENMSAADAMRPGDILRTLSGQTVEVMNTDAEGRLILADALTYAKRFEPAIVFDAATLTGSSIMGLGLRASAFFTKDDVSASRVAQAGEESGYYVWRMPLWDEYEENIKADFADFTNAPMGDRRFGDVVNAAMFLYQFAKDLGAPWVHLDIAPRMTAIESDKLAKGAAGTPVRLLVRFIEAYAA